MGHRSPGFEFDPPAFTKVSVEKSYKAACIQAKAWAVESNSVASIRRAQSDHWDVLVDSTSKALQEPEDDSYLYQEDFEVESNEEYYDRITRHEEQQARAEVDEELSFYSWGTARSNEEGWYYPDDD